MGNVQSKLIKPIKRKSLRKKIRYTDANLKSHQGDFLPQKRDYISSSDLKVTVSSTI